MYLTKERHEIFDRLSRSQEFKDWVVGIHGENAIIHCFWDKDVMYIIGDKQTTKTNLNWLFSEVERW